MAHADDIRTLTHSIDAYNSCTEIVETYMHENGLKLNRENCDVLLIPKIRESGSCTDLLSYSIVSKNTRELVHARLVQQDIDREGSEKSPKLIFLLIEKLVF